MTLFVITCSYPDVQAWKALQGPHLDWLERDSQNGALVAAGPLPGPIPAGLLIVNANDETSARAWLETDPFSLDGNLTDVTIRVWDPVFGSLQQESSLVGLSTGDRRATLLARAESAAHKASDQ